MDVPGWFSRALAAAPEHADVDVDGTSVHYRAWGDPDLPGLVLVHGGAAHSGWWDHVAPLLSSHRVVAPDLSGHGDSAWRSSYDPAVWADEVVAVAEHAGLALPVVVGHSMGGWVSVAIGGRHPDRVRAVAFLDAPLNDDPPEQAQLEARSRPRHVHPRLEDALARFTTLPPQDVVLPYVGDHVARGSLKQVEGGWTWKFDPSIFASRQRRLLRDLLPQVGVPAALFRSEHGLVHPQMAGEMATLVPDGSLAVVDVPDAGHHPMLDQPLALVTGLRTLLALWPTS